jgi:DNA-binding NarL/FixJ family response regulator
MLQIVVADDVDLVLKGIQSVLAGWSEGQIVGTYQAVPDLLDSLAKAPVDVLLLDDRIDPEYGPLRLIEQVKAIAPQTKIILLGTLADGMVVQEFFAHGIHAYLYKSDTLVDTLIPAMRAVLRGKPYLSPTASAEHLLAMQERRRRWQLDGEALTVLRLLAEGKHVSQIAALLHKKPYRIYAMRNRLRARFGADNNEALIARATAEGFLP